MRTEPPTYAHPATPQDDTSGTRETTGAPRRQAGSLPSAVRTVQQSLSGSDGTKKKQRKKKRKEVSAAAQAMLTISPLTPKASSERPYTSITLNQLIPGSLTVLYIPPSAPST